MNRYTLIVASVLTNAMTVGTDPCHVWARSVVRFGDFLIMLAHLLPPRKNLFQQTASGCFRLFFGKNKVVKNFSSACFPFQAVMSRPILAISRSLKP